MQLSVRLMIMKRETHLPGWLGVVVFLFVLLVVLPFIGDVFRRIPLAIFFLWISCPCLAWGLRLVSLDEWLTPHGYGRARGVLVGLAVVISFHFFAHYDYLRDHLADKYLDGYSVYYYEDVDEFGRPYRASDATAHGFFGKAILYFSQWVMIGMAIGIPVLTWRIASTSIDIAEARRRESNIRIDSYGQ